MPTGIGSGIAGDVFQNFLGDGSGGGGLVCPSQYSLLFNGVSQFSFVTGSAFDVAASASSLSVWINTSDRNGVAGNGQAIYASATAGLNPFSTYFDAEGVLNSRLGPMTFPAHPELITNGSFSDVPVGTELIANPTFSDAASITPWQITGSAATKSWSARFMRIEYTVAQGPALFRGSLGQTLNTMYSVKMRVRGVTAGGADQGSAFANIGDSAALTSANIISNPTLTSQYQDYEFRVWSTEAIFRFYLATAAIGDVVDFDSISVKPLDMLVDNGNFTDGVEGVDGGNFESGLIGTISNAGGTVYDWALNTVAPISGTQDGLLSITTVGTNVSHPRLKFDGNLSLDKSFVLTFDYKVNSGICKFSSINRGGGTSLNIPTVTLTGSGTYTFYFQGTGTGLLTINFDGTNLFDTQFDNVSIKELGEDWTVIDNTAGDTVTFGGSSATWTKTDPEAVYLQQDYPVTLGASHKLTYTVLSNTYTGGGTELGLSSLSAYGQSPIPSSVGTHTVYLIVTLDTPAAALRFYSNDTGGSLEITDVSVEELGEDWNFNTPPWTIGSTGLTSDGTNSNDMNQNTWLPELGKTYKVVYTIASITQGSYKITLGGVTTASENAAGTYTYYITATDLSNGGGRLRIQIDNDLAIGVISSISVEEVLSENEWHHLALSIDRDSEWKWYVDGVLTNTMDNATDVAPTVGGALGFTIPDSSIIGASDFTNGYMTEPSLWNIPLSASEVKDIYDNMYGGQRCLGSLPFTSDLITNGNFTQIGPELVTNGNFSATGSELLPDGASPMTGTWGGTGVIVDGKLVKNGAGITYHTLTNTPGKSYKAIVDVESLAAPTTFYLAGTNSAPLVVGTNTIYIVAGPNTPFGAGINDGWDNINGVGSVINSISVKELGEGWTLTNAIVSATPEGVGYFTDDGLSASNTAAYQTILDSTKNYKTSFEILEFIAPTLGMSAATTAGGFYPSAAGTFEKFLCPPDGTDPTKFRLVANDAADGFKMTNASVKEVGQGWTVVGSDATHYVEFPGVGARYVASSAGMLLAQTGIITPGKSYTVTCNVAYASGSGELRCQVGNVNSTPFVEGFNTVTVTATTGVSFYLVRNTSNVDCVITNVTVTQVGGGNLERWWRMNGTDASSYIVGNQAPNGTVNNLTIQNTPLIEREVP